MKVSISDGVLTSVVCACDLRGPQYHMALPATSDSAGFPGQLHCPDNQNEVLSHLSALGFPCMVHY